MIERPPIRYAKSGDAHIAYQVGGEGPPLVGIWGGFTHLGLMWEIPAAVRFIESYWSFSTTVGLDERGSGLSDPLPPGEEPTLQERAADVAAVMDDAGVERATVEGSGDGAAAAVAFVTTYPERVDRLVLVNACARVVRGDDYPCGYDRETVERWSEGVMRGYDDPDLVRRQVLFSNPGLADDPESLDVFIRYGRQALSPGQARQRLRRILDLDMRPLLPLVAVPTLVVHHTGNRMIPVEHGRYLAEHIDGARLVEIDTVNSLPGLDSDEYARHVQEFVTGSQAPVSTVRTLASVLVTDIVGSTERASELGDEQWRRQLDRHDEMVRRQIGRFSGVEINTTGDGFLVTFDSAARAVACAQAIRDGVRQVGLEVRAGVHAGEVEKRGDDISGIAVHVAQRISELADAGEICVSGMVKDLATGSGIEFADRGVHELKGVPDEWRVLAVVT